MRGLAERVGPWLRLARLRRAERGRVARFLGVTVRTLANWSRAAARPASRLGRPPRPDPVRRRIHRLVRREVDRQGWTAGWRPIHAALVGRCSRDDVERSLRAWKARRRRRLARHRAAARVSVRVLSRGAVWTQNATPVGRRAHRLISAEVVRDRGSRETLSVELGPTASGSQIVAGLERLAALRGWPLVWQTDRGSAYQSAPVQECLARHRVAWLPSRPHLPQDNASAERGIGELKAEAGVNAATVLSCVDDAAARLASAVNRLDGARRRPRLGGTVRQHAASMAECYHADIRDGFFASVNAALAAARPEGSTRVPPDLHRRVVYAALAKVGMVEITRGGTTIPLVEPEGIS